VRSAFGELYMPVLREKLELSAALRYDRYSDFGDTTNPRIGLYWRPAASLGIRAAYSTSFRAPAPNESFTQAAGRNIFTFNFLKPGGGVTPVFFLSGGSEELRPESADNITASVEFTPQGLPGFSVRADYYHIDFRDRIIAPSLIVDALLHPDIYGSLIAPLASDVDAGAFLQAQIDSGARYFNFTGTGPAGVRSVFNGRLQNAAVVKQDGVDLLASYRVTLGKDEFQTTLNLACISELTTAFSPASIPASTVDTYGNPLKYRARGTLGWSRGPLNAQAAVNYANSYRDTTVIPTARIASWTTADLNLSYAPVDSHGVGVNLNVLNLFDAAPPRAGSVFVSGNVFFDQANASPLGRFVSLELRKLW
jgi:iron complex outermembrane receptor protein